MQKLKEKKILGTVPKNYQRVENFLDCPEFSRKQQNQRGITLIALIITIIVMLILVGVTINVALNGGLFEKAKDAKEKTAAATEKEQLLNAVFATLDDNGKIHLDNIELPEGFNKSESSDNVFIGPSGKQYEVSKNTGAITDKEDEEKVDLAQYYLWYLQVIYGIIDISEIPQEEVEIAQKLVMEAIDQQLIYSFEVNKGIDDYSNVYISVNGYNYNLVIDSREEQFVINVSLIDKGSDENNKVNALVEESKNIEAELNELLVESEYTYSMNDWNNTLKTYIENNLSEIGDISVTDGGPENHSLYINSLVDEDIKYRYYVYGSEEESLCTIQSIVNRNNELLYS